MTERYDVVIFGASGFTGQYVVEEVARVAEEETGLTWALAGRSMEKLQKVLERASRKTGKEFENIPIIISDVSSYSTLVQMAEKSKIVLNCVGPYRFHGEDVVKACIEGGAHHIDISGEPQFLEKMQLLYHGKAREAGVYIVGSCGFDSIPSEMGMEFTKSKFNGDLNSVESFVDVTFGPAGMTYNYGTFESAVHGIATYGELPSLRKSLFPNPLPKSNYKLQRSDEVDKWCLPFPGSDRSIATRTQRYNYDVKNERPFPGLFTFGAFSKSGPSQSQEEKLTQLQKSVESEEKIWQEKLHTSESELNQSKQEITTLKEELKKHHGSTEHLNDVDFAYRCVEKSLPTIVEQMEDKIEELKGELEKVEFEKKQNTDKSKITELEHKIQIKEESHTVNEKTAHQLKNRIQEFKGALEKIECESRITELEHIIHTKEESHTLIERQTHEKEQQIVVLRTEVEKLKKSDEDLEALGRLIAELKTQLESEKKKSQELASNNVKLNGIIKTGQDSLREEQKLISKLQDQIETMSASSTSSQTMDIAELKTKLAEKESQLEKEMQKCNQLNQQLASKGTESGTSV